MGKVVTLGEIMLRLSTTDGIRISQTKSFQAHYGGGEANVAVSLANYGHEVYFASKIPEANNLSESVKRHLQSYGVSTKYLLQGGPRLGTYYLEAGTGERGASVIYDRAYSSFSLMAEDEWNSAKIFKDVDIFHVSGITPALSHRWRKLILDLIQSAKAAGCKISFDINYRGKLWTQAEASETIKKILPFVDYCSAGKLDAIYLLGISEYNESDELICYYQEIQKIYPSIQVLYSTKREVISASANDLTGFLWMGQQLFQSKTHHIDPIVDRVGSGDAFSGGVLHGLLEGMTPQKIIDFGTAAAALKHTVEGDCNQFSVSEVENFLKASSGKIIR
ncbi:sugar kinase [Bacillus pseudomycoides]|uniref:sugar kinase n=1 Tax=Bacillus pseudomycoides TaxID=64104 RepID=UPI000BF47B4B|nr:sugar kinase [Bacillus pseudomycoides]PGC29331.1 2-dehydro-3-deoxygluconokinase [Bacillus pseudomycoides]